MTSLVYLDFVTDCTDTNADKLSKLFFALHCETDFWHTFKKKKSEIFTFKSFVIFGTY